jgi:hypothetical protein
MARRGTIVAQTNHPRGPSKLTFGAIGLKLRTN